MAMIIKEKISKEQFTKLVEHMDILKFAVDVERGIMAAGCYFHIDCAEELMGDGSRAGDIWGANVYPAERKIDFSAVFNIRPLRNNRSMDIQDAVVRAKVGVVARNLLPLWD